jgi:hypothetical protein
MNFRLLVGDWHVNMCAILCRIDDCSTESKHRLRADVLVKGDDVNDDDANDTNAACADDANDVNESESVASRSEWLAFASKFADASLVTAVAGQKRRMLRQEAPTFQRKVNEAVGVAASEALLIVSAVVAVAVAVAAAVE